MKIGLISAFAIFLLLSIFVNLVTASHILSKKITSDSPVAQFVNVANSLLVLFFTIAIIYKSYKSGWKI